MGRKQLVDADGVATGNSWNRATTEDEEGATTFAGLLLDQEGCSCGYEGPLRSTRKGYKCPECRTIVIPSE